MATRQVKVEYGEKMIEVRVRFYTNNLADEGYIIPKHGWTNGAVQMDRNDFHKIESGKSFPFNSIMEIPAAIEKALVDQKIALHRVRRMSKYIV